MGWLFGIEHEVAFLKKDGQFADFTNTKLEEFERIIKKLPIYRKDKLKLRVDRFGIMKSRWYIEGYERFNNNGSLKEYIPKGIEIRTTPQPTIDLCIKQFKQNFNLLKLVSKAQGFYPILISYNPFKKRFSPQPPFSRYEIEKLKHSPEDRTEYIAMLTYGPDLNLSLDSLSDKKIVDIGKKLTYYSPFIVPFSFSSPFYNGKLWNGFSVRTYKRTGKRHAARVFINDAGKLISDNALTRLSRITIEKGRIEFKAFDSCDNPNLYAALLTLLKGMILDNTLKGRRVNPNARLHQISARYGFKDFNILTQARKILKAVEIALGADPDIKYLQLLKEMLKRKTSPAQEMLDEYQKNKSIEKTLRKQSYEKFF